MLLVSRNKTIKYIVIGIAVLLFLCMVPLHIITYSVTEKSDEIIERESEPISVEYNMTQMFEGTGGELTSVDLYIFNDMSDQIMTFRLYDENHEQIYEQFVNVPNTFVAPGYFNIPVRFNIEDKKEYSFIVEGLTSDLYLAYEDRNTSSSPVNIMMAYGGAEVPEYNLVVRYNYSCPFNVAQSLLCAVICVIICVAVSVAAKRCNDKQVRLRKVFQIIVTPVAVAAVVLIFGIVMGKRIFGIDTKNNAFITIGLWMLIAIPTYIVNWGRINIEELRGYIDKKTIIRILRIISIATVLWYCYEYMNGLYDIYHYYSISKLAVAFLCLIITTFDKKEILNWPNAVWLIAGPVLGYLYHKPQIGVPELDELYRLNAWVIAVGGFVVINIIYSVIRLAKKNIKMNQVDIRFAIPFCIFAVGICVLSNTRYWTYLLIGICVLLIYRLLISDVLAEFTDELCAGIILNFYMMVWFSLCHRPYYYYHFYRYNMGYHTVTVTAYYLSMVLCAAWVRLFVKYKKCSHWTEMIPQLFTFGMAASYLVFTMSRTGFLSAGMMIVFAVVVSALMFYNRGEKIKKTAKIAGFMIAAFVYMFPITFSLTDIMPRIANDPVVFDYEWRWFSFTKGMPYSSIHYMTIEHFSDEFCKKVFGIELDNQVSAITILDPFALPVYAEEVADEGNENDSLEEDVTDMSNGRFDIFRCYISNLNAWGHDEMGVEMPNGEIAVHAHNTFLQVAHDHGVIFGVFFVLFTGYVVLLSLFRAYKCKTDIYRLFCPIVVVGFSMAGLVEWLLHPCNPYGLVIFMAMMPLFFKDVVNEKSN